MNDLMMNTIAHARIDDLHRQAAEAHRRHTEPRDTTRTHRAPRRGFTLFRRLRTASA